MRQCGLVLALFAVGVFGLVGCGGDTNVPGDSKGAKIDNGSQVNTPDGQPATSEAGAPKDIPAAEDPSLAVRRVLQGVQDGQASAIWAFLPSRYQKQINALGRNLADKMDAKIWNRTFVSLKRLVDIARTKKGLLIKASLYATAQQNPDARQFWMNFMHDNSRKRKTGGQLLLEEQTGCVDILQIVFMTATQIFGEWNFACMCMKRRMPSTMFLKRGHLRDFSWPSSMKREQSLRIRAAYGKICARLTAPAQGFFLIPLL